MTHSEARVPWALRRISIVAALTAAGFAIGGTPAAAHAASRLLIVCGRCPTTSFTYNSIQDAIDHDSNGATIMVLGGTYDENLHVDGAYDQYGGESAANITVRGSGKVIVNGGENGSVLIVGSGYAAKFVNITLTGGSYIIGGGIYNSGTVALEGTSSVTDNSALYGGGIFNYGVVTLAGTASVSGNTASSFGGGIVNGDPGAGLTMAGNSTVHDNHGGSDGGGIYAEGPVTMMGTSSIYKNTTDANGGDILDGEGTVTLEQSATIHNNTAAVSGGGVYVAGGSVVGPQSSIYANTPDNCVNC
jgi:predicted outer membrane repeat protein